MSKKPGQISANTLSLRFMQNAAKAKQQKEVEAAKAKVKSQEEWEVAPHLRQTAEDDDVLPHREQAPVTYEQSYLPFLFPGPSDARATTTTMASTTKEGSSDELSEDEIPNRDAATILVKGRRKFGKHGKEETTTNEKESEGPQISASASASTQNPLRRGARAISSHGHTAPASSKPSTSRKPHSTIPPDRPPAHAHAHAQYAPPPPTKTPTPMTPKQLPLAHAPPTFLKPQVDAPSSSSSSTARKQRTRTKRPFDRNSSSTSAEGEPSNKKKKKAET